MLERDRWVDCLRRTDEENLNGLMAGFIGLHSLAEKERGRGLTCYQLKAAACHPARPLREAILQKITEFYEILS